MATDTSLNLNLLNSRIIDGSNSQTQDQLYFIGTGNNYVKKSDSATSINVKQSGNFLVVLTTDCIPNTLKTRVTFVDSITVTVNKDCNCVICHHVRNIIHYLAPVLWILNQ